MASPIKLSEHQIYHACPRDRLPFETTEHLEILTQPLGQDRVLRAMKFSADMSARGFNLFVLGPSGTGKNELVMQFLESYSAGQPVPTDWCYVYNFDASDKPRAMSLPAGEGRKFRKDMQDLASELKTTVPAVFEGDEYQARMQELQEEVARRQQQGLVAIQEEARRSHIAMLTTPAGFTFAPLRNGEVVDPEEYKKNFSDAEKALIESKVEELQKKLQQAIQQLPRLRKEVQERVHALNEEMVQLALGAPFEELREHWKHVPAVLDYLQAVHNDIIEHAEMFQDDTKGPPSGLLNRYRVNLLVDNTCTEGAPVVYEDLPTHQHLAGQIEHRAHQGNLHTDFTLIKSGSLHRANGGYLVVDAHRILSHPAAWESLKRVLFSGEIHIESLERLYGLVSTVSLQPEPIPASLKVVLLGNRMLYYLLSHHDPDFADLFKVEADFEDDIDRTDANYELYARMIATMARDVQTRHLSRDAVARTIEHASRLASDQKKLTAHDRSLKDLLSEADYWAGQNESELIEASHIQQAIDEQEYRASRVRDRSLEQIQRGVVMIDTSGAVAGQVNGLSVYRLGKMSFGQPTRITATARPGRGQVVDIEREVKLGGAIHSKAVMILSRFLASRYAPESELSLSASLAFEQSYGGIDGDSASVAETCVLLSAIAGVPLKQSLAVTGSMNQHGEVQAVGGVNEKIEGFFKVCQQAGDIEDQGVLLPASNVEHLMLNAEVRHAVRTGRFSIYAIHHIDEAIELMTGLEAGQPDAEGQFPAGSFNRKVADRLASFARVGQRKDDASDTDPLNGDKKPGGEKKDVR